MESSVDLDGMEEDPLDTVKDICKDTRGGKITVMLRVLWVNFVKAVLI